jgi:hypothetical protein
MRRNDALLTRLDHLELVLRLAPVHARLVRATTVTRWRDIIVLALRALDANDLGVSLRFLDLPRYLGFTPPTHILCLVRRD